MLRVDEVTQSIASQEAPDDGSVGLWYGNGDVNDDEGDYYVVHSNTSEGDMALLLEEGDPIVMMGKTYVVYGILFVERETTFGEVREQAVPGGDTIALQVCVPGSNWYKICMAKP